jgi:hypothetical protein
MPQASLLIASSNATAAFITAGISLLVALTTASVGAFFQTRNNRAVKKLEEEKAASNARLAYDFEARKRLYTVCEPLLFQGMQQAEEARSRISSLAQSARNGHLQTDGKGWMDRPDRYYFKSVAYGLLAPITTFSVLQRRLTMVDLGLDPAVRAKYELLKLIFFSFCQDWELAKCGTGHDILPYDRNKADRGEPHRDRLMRDSPQQHAPQGLYRAIVYVIAEAFTHEPAPADAAGTSSQCMAFGEFQREWNRAAAERQSLSHRTRTMLRLATPGTAPMAHIFEDIVELLLGFHPLRKPVLWRVLLTQYMLYGALTRGVPTLDPMSGAERQRLDWRAPGEGYEIDSTITIAEEFVLEQLKPLQARLEHESQSMRAG